MGRDPLAAMHQWQKTYGDMVHLRIWPEHQIVLTDPDLARELLVGHHASLIRWERGIAVLSPLHSGSVLMAEGEAWRHKRQHLQPEFAPKPVQAFVPAISAAAANGFAQWRTGATPWPIESAFTSMAMDVIMRATFSCAVDADGRAAEQAVHDVSVAANAEMFWPASWPDFMPWKRSKRQAIRVLKRLIERHVQARLARARAEWPGDLLSRLLTLHLDDPNAWPLQAIHDECMTTFMAGHETVAATLTWWAWCMAANPLAQQAARLEVEAVLQAQAPVVGRLPALVFLNATLQETLRMYPAAPVLLTRRTTKDVTLGGWQFPAKTMFTVPVQLMQHDPRWFPEPHVFRPERFLAGAPPFPRGAFMPFGAGPRVCLGQHLAMAEMTVIAAMLLQRFELTVPDGMAAPRPLLNISLRPAQPLHLRLAGRPTN